MNRPKMSMQCCQVLEALEADFTGEDARRGTCSVTHIRQIDAQQCCLSEHRAHVRSHESFATVSARRNTGMGTTKLYSFRKDIGDQMWMLNSKMLI